jgi:hypothetical protein
MFHPKNNINIMQQPIEEIKKLYPDEWLLLGSPVKDKNGWIIAAELLYHSTDKRELVKMDKPLMKNHKHFASLFNRVTPHNVSCWMSLWTISKTSLLREGETPVPIRSSYQQ